MSRLIQKILYTKYNCIRLNNFMLSSMLCAQIHKNDPIVFENTLVYTVLEHFRSNPTYQTQKVCATENKTEDDIEELFKNRNCLTRVSTDELLSHMMILSKNNICDSKIIKNVDEELCDRLRNKCDYKEILKITNSLLYFTHNTTSRTKSYRLCIESIFDIVRHNEMTLQHFIQCTFYTSVLKNDPLARETISQILHKIHFQTSILKVISPVELAIFCNSVYKTGTKIKSKKILIAIIDAIEKGADKLFVTPELCTSILKPLHQAKYTDYDFLNRLSKNIINKNGIDVDNYEFSSLVYLFKLYSNALHNDNVVTEYLANKAVFKLNNMYKNEDYIRAKDISILLKSCCELGSEPLKKVVVEKIFPIVYDAVMNKNIQSNELKSLTEITLWLSILDTSLLEGTIIEKLVTPRLITIGKTSVKGRARMNLLLTVLSIEKVLPLNKEAELLTFIEPDEKYDLEKYITMRPKLYTIYEALECLSLTIKTIRNVKFWCQIPNLYMPGVTLETDSYKKIAIECLDEKVCLHNTQIPNGYMKLKSRLLKKMGYLVITVPQSAVDKGSEYLFATLEDTIRNIENGQDYWL